MVSEWEEHTPRPLSITGLTLYHTPLSITEEGGETEITKTAPGSGKGRGFLNTDLWCYVNEMFLGFFVWTNSAVCDERGVCLVMQLDPEVRMTLKLKTTTFSDLLAKSAR